jgi:hypothetical protein
MTINGIRTAAAFALIVVACVVPRKSDAQSIAQRVSSAKNGKVGFTFAPKPGVCGHNNSISRGGAGRYNWSDSPSADVEYDRECSHFPVRVVLEVRDGNVQKIRTYVGGRWRSGSTLTDLGTFSTKAATDYLLNLAATSDSRSAAHDAIIPATLADSVTIWPALVKIGRDTSVPSSVRKQAIFWLAQEASDHIAGTRGDRNDPDSEVKKQAVFALSQHKSGESVETLMEVARRNRDPEVRRTALFWLGQTNDPRVVPFFEDILKR